MLIVFAFVLSTLCPPLAFAADEQTVILQKPVKVTAKDIDGSETDHYQLELGIEYGDDRFKFRTNLFQISSFNEAIQYERTRTHWQGPYLLVGYERGGGNASRGYLDTVFILKKGKLLYLGEVDADSYEKGVFKDTYNQFELNNLTSHAEAPLIRLIIEEKGGQLLVNLEKTRSENQKRFNQNREIIRELLNNKKIDPESLVTELSGSLLYNAVLSKYCNRQADLDSILKIAKRVLDAKRLKIFNDILSRVVPGELPKPAVEVEKY